MVYSNPLMSNVMTETQMMEMAVVLFAKHKLDSHVLNNHHRFVLLLFFVEMVYMSHYNKKHVMTLIP